MIIPTEVEAKIRHICSIIHEVEWSGVLFYTHSGSMDDGSFVVKCEDIYVMDIGSGTYTEYKENATILDYRIQNNLLTEEIQEGLIHSHNNMSTFFSGTDRDTLVEEGTNSNHFVSLIVNNEGKYTARVTRKITREVKAVAHIIYDSNSYYNSYGDNKVILEKDKHWEEDREESRIIQEIEYFNLDIEKQEASNPFTAIDERLREIKREKDAATRKYSYNSVRDRYPYLNTYNKEKYPKEPDSWKQTQFQDNSFYDDYYNDYYDRLYAQQHIEDPANVVNDVKTTTQKDVDVDVPMCLTEDADPELIKLLAAQILSGDITVDPDKFNAEEFVRGMDSLYEKKFGPLIEDDYPNLSDEIIEENNKRLENWINGILDYAVYNEDKKLLEKLKKEYGRKFTEIDTAEVIATDLWVYLNKLPESYVKELIMNTLMDYIPDGAKEYI